MPLRDLTNLADRTTSDGGEALLGNDVLADPAPNVLQVDRPARLRRSISSRGINLDNLLENSSGLIFDGRIHHLGKLPN